jgi:23S rRNA (adenine2503-C2)-methyltransferase
VHINLIPYNATSADAGLAGTPLERRRCFAAAMTRAGYPVTIRYSLGHDIAAACGQLVLLETAPS